MTQAWSPGNRVELLVNGEEYYPRVFGAMRQARQEILVETFIIFDDPIGQELRTVLIEAASRGVRVELIADGYGTADLGPEFIAPMTAAGVRVHLYDARPKLLGVRLNLWRRMHRKIVAIDGRLGFVGGLNFSHDHVRAYGPEAKQDYAVEVEGPVVADLRALVQGFLPPLLPRFPMYWWRRRRLPQAPPPMPPQAGTARAMLVVRDNERHRDDIERHYREAIRKARREVVIANAYFFPGYRLLRALRLAARRGVKVSLILQGNPDMPKVKWAASTLYEPLLRAGVVIHEYCERPLHGKVAYIDDDWSTVGSSNLDPLSLFLNLEANLFVLDRDLNRQLRESLGELMERHCTAVPASLSQKRTLLRQFLTMLAFHLMRRFPRWAGWLPGHRQRQMAYGAVPQVESTQRKAA